MKAKLIVCILCLVVTAFALTGCATTYQAYFEEVWLDKLIQYAAVLTGALSAVAVLASKVKKRSDEVTGLLSKLGDKENLLREATAQLAEAKLSYQATIDALVAKLEWLQEDRDRNLQKLGELKDAIKTLKEGLVIALGNDPELVRTGHAKEIVSLWEVEDER